MSISLSVELNLKASFTSVVGGWLAKLMLSVILTLNEPFYQVGRNWTRQLHLVQKPRIDHTYIGLLQNSDSSICIAYKISLRDIN